MGQRIMSPQAPGKPVHVGNDETLPATVASASAIP